MDCTGAGRGKVKFGDPFFRWLRDHLLMVEDYAYVGTDFRGDLDLPLPPSAQWGDMKSMFWLSTQKNNQPPGHGCEMPRGLHLLLHNLVSGCAVHGF